MKQNVNITVRLSEELLRKLCVAAQAEKRTLNNQLLHMIRQNIAYHEKTKGRITAEQMNAVVLPEDNPSGTIPAGDIPAGDDKT